MMNEKLMAKASLMKSLSVSSCLADKRSKNSAVIFIMRINDAVPNNIF